MKALAILLLAVCAVAWQAAPALAAPGGGGEIEQRMVDIEAVDPDQVVARAASIGEKVWQMAQAFSLPATLVSLVLGAFLVVIGSLVSRRLLGTGFGVIFAGLLAFLLINYAPEIAGLTKALAGGVLGR